MRRIPNLGIVFINGSVESLGVTDFHITGGPFWADNLLDPRSIWQYVGTTPNKNCGSQSGGIYGSIDDAWNFPVHAHSAYQQRISDNTRAVARHYVLHYARSM